MGDQHPNETAGPSRLPTGGPKTSDSAVVSVPCDSTDSSSVEEMESEADFATFTSRRLKRKLRRTSASRDSQPALDTGKQRQRNHSGHRIDKSTVQDKHMTAQHNASTPISRAPRPSDAQKEAESAKRADASDAEWPSLPSGAIGKTISWATSPTVAHNDRQDFEKTQNILKNLLKSIRAILCELQTPGAKAAVQILNVLEPLLVELP
ncbi:hypothetical protein HPB52_013890 [Rhipicephalus sanguineus]|uniref:Uncharacterized protein n=1 Tax=Rhipicephalus sanguineus TaxID=34632 RepID=A0A9D4QB62_RHISA|nr:hypothetical protein HPB52_013890 [Rhipicephalus sanguineus]